MLGGPEPKRYLFINHWASRLGGAELSLADILACMARRAEVHLLTTEEGPLTDAARREGVHCHVIALRHGLADLRREALLKSVVASWRGLLSFAVYATKAMQLVGKLDPVLIHANVPKSHVTLLLIRLCGHKGPCCLHIREIFEPRSVPLLLYRLLWRPRRGHVLSISAAVQDHLPKPIRACSQVIYNGVKTPPAPLALPVSPPLRFLYLGRIVPWKGCHLLVESFQLLRQMRPHAQVQFSFVGDTLYWDQSYRQDLVRAIHEHGLSSCCTIRSHAADPYAEIGSHHVLCMASRREPFGRTAAEAHACGRPVVAFDGGGIGEVVEHGRTGLLVAYGDVEKLAEAMAGFVDDPAAIARCGAAGHARARRLFNREVQIPMICDALEAMREGRGAVHG